MDAPNSNTTVEPCGSIGIIPVEILEEIFKCYFEQAIDHYDRTLLDSSIRVDVPIRLGAVCAQWRRIAHGMSLLWSFIQMDTGEQSREMKIAKLILYYLERSGSQPLRLAVRNFTQRTPIDILSPLSDMLLFRILPLDRVHHLTLKEPKSLQGDFELHGFSLKKFHHLTGFDLIGDSSRNGATLNLQIDQFCPDIQSVRLHGCTFGSRMFSENNRIESLCFSEIVYRGSSPYLLPLSNLRTLHFAQTREAIWSTINISGFGLGSRLVHLILEDVAPSALAWVSQNEFNCLTHLSIRRDRLQMADHMLQFVRKIGPIITHLELMDVGWDRVPWTIFFMNWADLQCLRICSTKNSSIDSLNPLFVALTQPILRSRNTLKNLSRIELIAPNCSNFHFTRPLHQFIESMRDGTSDKITLIAPPNIFVKEDIWSLSNICTLHVTEWDDGKLVPHQSFSI
jgi:hypothetical protein